MTSSWSLSRSVTIRRMTLSSTRSTDVMPTGRTSSSGPCRTIASTSGIWPLTTSARPGLRSRPNTADAAPKLPYPPRRAGRPRPADDVVAVDEDRPPACRRQGGREVGGGLAGAIARLCADDQHALERDLAISEDDPGRDDAVRRRHPRRGHGIDHEAGRARCPAAFDLAQEWHGHEARDVIARSDGGPDVFEQDD